MLGDWDLKEFYYWLLCDGDYFLGNGGVNSKEMLKINVNFFFEIGIYFLVVRCLYDGYFFYFGVKLLGRKVIVEVRK